MFKQLSEILEEGNNEERKIYESYKSKKEKNTIDIQNTLNSELKSISNDSSYKDYNPTTFHNTITTLKHERETLVKQEHGEVTELFNKIITKMFANTLQLRGTLEIYKIINKCNTPGGCPYYICRVWFTLVNIKTEKFTYKEGDPIRVEWLKIDGRPRLDDTNSSIQCSYSYLDGPLPIPYFDSAGSVTNAPILFRDDNSDYPIIKKFWDEWVQKNRPL